MLRTLAALLPLATALFVCLLSYWSRRAAVTVNSISRLVYSVCIGDYESKIDGCFYYNTAAAYSLL
jgi:hypothetical protein